MSSDSVDLRLPACRGVMNMPVSPHSVAFHDARSLDVGETIIHELSKDQRGNVNVLKRLRSTDFYTWCL
jgi:hypothetical protein